MRLLASWGILFGPRVSRRASNTYNELSHIMKAIKWAGPKAGPVQGRQATELKFTGASEASKRREVVYREGFGGPSVDWRPGALLVLFGAWPCRPLLAPLSCIDLT